MLRHSGLQANPILISTRDHGIPIYPTRTAFNYVIAAVEDGTNTILLDASNKNAMPNILPEKALNWVGKLIRKDGTSTNIDLMPTNNSNDIINAILSISKDGIVEGKVREQYTDYFAFEYRETDSKLSKEAYIEKLEKQNTGLEITDLDIQSSTDSSSVITEKYTVKHSNSVEIIDGKMYFSPLLFFATTKNPFTQESRLYPIDFIFPRENKYSLVITIPEGYVVESFPESKSFAMTDKIVQFKYIVSTNERQIQIMVTKDINSSIISPDFYEDIKAVYAEIVKKQSEKIVIKNYKFL